MAQWLVILLVPRALASTKADEEVGLLYILDIDACITLQVDLPDEALCPDVCCLNADTLKTLHFSEKLLYWIVCGMHS